MAADQDIVQEPDFKDNMVPMVCRVSREQLLMAINQNFHPQYRLPLDAEITVTGHGGDWPESIRLEVKDDVMIEVRWKRKGLP